MNKEQSQDPCRINDEEKIREYKWLKKEVQRRFYTFAAIMVTGFIVLIAVGTMDARSSEAVRIPLLLISIVMGLSLIRPLSARILAIEEQFPDIKQADLSHYETMYQEDGGKSRMILLLYALIVVIMVGISYYNAKETQKYKAKFELTKEHTAHFYRGR